MAYQLSLDTAVQETASPTFNPDGSITVPITYVIGGTVKGIWTEVFRETVTPTYAPGVAPLPTQLAATIKADTAAKYAPGVDHVVIQGITY